MNEFIKKLENTNNYIVLKKFVPLLQYNLLNEKKNLQKGIFIDIETTGLNFQYDIIIELAFIQFEFDSNGIIYKILKQYTGFNDPVIFIPRYIQKLTSISNKIVKNKKINISFLKKSIEESEIIISHNAEFDRPFLENFLGIFNNINWGCSAYDINWYKRGIDSKKLSYIAYKYKIFYNAHRALIDCQVGLNILNKDFLTSKKKTFKELLKNIKKRVIRIFAYEALYIYKDVLKSRGYKWEANIIKSWYVDLNKLNIYEEIYFLSSEVYKNKINIIYIMEINSKQRFSVKRNM